MKTHVYARACAAALLFVGLSAQAAPPLPGAIFTTNKDGTIVNGNTKYGAKCDDLGVYLDGGPGPNAPRTAASLPDGDYYFQVTDPPGKTLLSTDPVKNRCITVSGGVIIGRCPTGTHETYPDADQGSSGAQTVELCAPPSIPFLDTPNNGGVYKVWVTPVGDGTLAGGGFFGDPNNVTNDCGGGRGAPGCFFGFIASRSKTDNFKVKDTPTYCIAVYKQLSDKKGTSTHAESWPIYVTAPTGETNVYYTGPDGSTGTQICSLTAGTYVVAEGMLDGYVQIGVELNGTPVSSSEVAVTLGSGKVRGTTQTVLFVNEYVGVK